MENESLERLYTTLCKKSFAEANQIFFEIISSDIAQRMPNDENLHVYVYSELQRRTGWSKNEFLDELQLHRDREGK